MTLTSNSPQIHSDFNSTSISPPIPCATASNVACPNLLPISHVIITGSLTFLLPAGPHLTQRPDPHACGAKTLVHSRHTSTSTSTYHPVRESYSESESTPFIGARVGGQSISSQSKFLRPDDSELANTYQLEPLFHNINPSSRTKPASSISTRALGAFRNPRPFSGPGLCRPNPSASIRMPLLVNSMNIMQQHRHPLSWTGHTHGRQLELDGFFFTATMDRRDINTRYTRLAVWKE
ncbi:hypothetical protein R3P38DRAFT_1475049 [Favolaschia claudopus]|uniref:Uncharacterized protein n=1 Tax=Favolaschia claudopus TaxID=2862362 RepID=A0AAW0DSP3_9AGAR